jgi:hypothetical protein
MADIRNAIGRTTAADSAADVISAGLACREAPGMPLELNALETSFDVIAPLDEELMDIFYVRLFAAAPAVEPLFDGADAAGVEAAA